MIPRRLRPQGRRARILSAALLTVLASGCGGASSPTAPSGTSLALVSSAKSLSTNGTAIVTAQLRTIDGRPQSGVAVSFATTLGALDPEQAVTNGEGTAIAVFSAGAVSGTAVVTARSGDVGANAVSIEVGTAAVGRVTVAATPASLPFGGGTTTITATVTDAGGNPLQIVPVSFTTSSGTLAPANLKTDAKGVVQTTLSTTGAAVVTAVAGASPGDAIGSAFPSLSGSVAVSIEPPPRPVVSITPSPNAVAGTAVTFTIGATPAPGSTSRIENVSVTFGDGSEADLGAASGSSIVAQHVYAAAGSYTVSVTATDSGGGSATASTILAVAGAPAAPPLSVTVAAGPMVPAGGGPNTIVTLTATASPSSRVIATYVWNFGDGSAPQDTTSNQVQHLYVRSDRYTVSVTATDANGVTATGTIPLSTASTPSTVSVTASADPVAGRATTFTISATPPSGSSATIQSLRISFGDGTQVDLGGTSGSATTQHVYQNADTYTVTVTALDTAGGTATASAVVVVRAPGAPTVSVSAGPNAVAGTATAFTVSATPAAGTTIQNVEISFGDNTAAVDLGAVSGTATVQHLYAAAGTYTARVTATATGGASTQASTVVVVASPQSPRVSIAASANPTALTTTTFTITAAPATSSSNITRVQVDYGDGSPVVDLGATSGSTTVQHVYSRPGTFTASVTAADSGGGTANAFTSVIVVSPVNLSITVSANPAARVPVRFTVSVFPAPGVTVQNVSVSYGDGTQENLGAVSGAIDTTHVYATAGTYTASANATITGGATVSAVTQIVIVSPVTLSITHGANPVARTPVQFTLSVVPAPGITVQNVSVTFGDGGEANLGAVTGASIQTTHVYAAAGLYRADVDVTINGGVVVNAGTSVPVAAPPPPTVTLTVLRTAVVFPGFTRVDFSVTVRPAAGTNINIVNVQLLYGDGGGDNLGALNGTAEHSHVYPWIVGPFVVRLIAVDDAGRTSETQLLVGPF